ncbi:MAG: hypothetical protein NC915_02915 [Candidatus Omnitrophica bacterium]|nr:hypothetical protein [Candidatus Omnitrophota bacterium]
MIMIKDWKNLFVLVFILLFVKNGVCAKNVIEIIIENTEPITIKSSKRLPLFVWTSIPLNITEDEMKKYLNHLIERNIVVFTRWRIPKEGIESGIKEAIKIDKKKKELNYPVVIDATSIVHRFFDGSEETGHIDENGNLFFDMSFSDKVKMGCPFKIDKRYNVIKERLEKFLKAYKDEGIDIKYWAVDWEIDGPIEWNSAWENSKKCIICRKNIKNIENFDEFQKVIRKKRADLQREVFVDTIKKYFPNCLIGNYAVNPHDGYRYWWDYFEKEVEGATYQRKHNALHRKWFDEFKYSGYTMAMPVIYTWYKFFNDYTFEEREYRWFYPLLREGTSVGKNTSQNIPIISFVHWQTVLKPKELLSDFVPLSREKYKELLWHLLFRGFDTFCLWSPLNEMAEEIKVLHEVYTESFKYNDFILNGKPVLWDVPEEPDTVISGLKLKNKLLIIRSDFREKKEVIKVKVDSKQIEIPVVSNPFILEIK